MPRKSPLSFEGKLGAYRLNESSILGGALHKLGSCVFGGFVPFDHKLVRGPKALWSRALFTRHCQSKHLGEFGEVKELIGDQSRLRTKVVESKSSGREAAGRTIIPPGLGGERAVSGGRERPSRLDRIGVIFVWQKITRSFTPLTNYNAYQLKGGEKGGK